MALALAPTLPPSAPLIAASYERVSTRIQAAAGFSLITQRQGIDEYCADHSLQLPAHLRFRDGVDADASGAEWNLPDLQRMLAVAKARAFQVLVVPDYDRFARNMAKALTLEALLAEYGVQVRYMNLPVDDSPEGQLIRRQFFSMAQYDRDKRAILTATNRRTKAREGYYVGNGPPPYGHEYARGGPRNRVLGLRIVDSEAAVVREVFAQALTQPVAEIRRDLDARGVPSPRELRQSRNAPHGWRRTTLYAMLANPLYVGRAQWGGLEIAVPAIVDAATFDAVQAAIRSRHRQAGAWAKTRADGDPYLLRGLLVCGPCSTPTRVVRLYSRRTRAQRYYECPNHARNLHHDRAASPDAAPCSMPVLRAELIEGHLWDRVVDELLDPARIRAHLEAARERRSEYQARHQEQVAALDATRAAEQRRLERLVRRLSEFDDELSPEDAEECHILEQQREEVKRTLTGLRRQREELDRGGDSLPSGLTETTIAAVAEFAETLRTGAAATTPAERHHILELLRLRGIVGPGTDITIQRRPPRTVSVEWTCELRIHTGRFFWKKLHQALYGGYTA